MLDERINPIGMSLDRLKQMVARNHHVVAVVGGDTSRIDPIYAAIAGKMINVLVTDSATAELLLKKKL